MATELAAVITGALVTTGLAAFGILAVTHRDSMCFGEGYKYGCNSDMHQSTLSFCLSIRVQLGVQLYTAPSLSVARDNARYEQHRNGRDGHRLHQRAVPRRRGAAPERMPS